MNKRTCGWIALAVVLVTLGWWGFRASKLREVYHVINPPGDYFAVIAGGPLTMGRQEYRWPLTHKYPGDHEVRLSWPHGRSHDFDGISLQFRRNGRPILAAKAAASRAFSGPRGDGVIIFEYRVPRDLPMGAGMECELVFAQPIDARVNGVVVEVVKAGH
ncbi:MAG: hypothetical protein H3C27_04870 [Opitutaceae bacterium]|nr:hypothetical protein [Opitutaceae bacterium]